jgi:hypothetical protein
LEFKDKRAVQTPESRLDTKPPRRLSNGGFMVVLHDMNPNDHSQILPISHMKVYLISRRHRFYDILRAFYDKAQKPLKNF